MTKIPASIKPELVHCNLKAGTKEDALRELVQVLASAEPSIVIEEILQALDDRERKGPFSIAKGVAFPHARTEGVHDFTIVIGTKPGGIDFRAPDGHNVRILVLFVIPKKHSNLYLKTLAWFLNYFHASQKTKEVAELSNSEDVLRAFSGADTQTRSNIFQPCTHSVTKETPLRSVLAFMAQNQLDAIPVVNEDQTFVGEISLDTLFRSEHLQGMDKIETVLEKAGDLPIKSMIEKDTYLAVETEEAPFLLGETLAKQGVRRAYFVKNGHLQGSATLTDLLYRCWKKE